MSREEWRKACDGMRDTSSISNWREAFAHTPASDKTDDPEAAEYDEASDIFLNGVKLARSGDVVAGRANIATAFLLDSRSVNFCSALPEPDAAEMAVDLELMQGLVEHDELSFASSVIVIMMAQYCGITPEGQALISVAMLAIQKFLLTLEEHPEMEEALGGCLKRTTLLFIEASFHMAMGSRKQAIKSLARALKIDPGCTKARDARASLWALSNMKDPARIHAEFQQILSELHEDSRSNENSYAWLAITTLKDSKLGTLDDAKRYYEKSLRATIRKEEIYGPRPAGKTPTQAIRLMRTQFAAAAVNADFEKFRSDLDSVTTGDRCASSIKIPEGMVAVKNPGPDKRMRYSCLKCAKTEVDIGKKMSFCTKCKKANYCSRECQVADWPNHKKYCKMIRLQMQASSAPVPASPPVPSAEELKAKEPLDKPNRDLMAVARMEIELRKRYQEHGERFATWWSQRSK